ncbi:MAG: divalent-cation tolerance protein CutA [Planctomycetota bacterium]
MIANLIVCWTTVATPSEAEKLATALLEESLAACIQIDSATQSHYRWNGEQHCDEEHRLWIKSTDAKWESLKSRLQQLHPYDEPQIVMARLADASEGYARWVESECS